MFDHSDSSDCEGHPLPHRRPQQLHEPHHLRGRKRKWKCYKKTGFHRNFKKGLPLLGEVSAHAVRKHQHHQDPLLQQAKNTKIAELQICKKHKDCRIANLQKTQRLQNCKFANANANFPKKCKFSEIAKITKMATKYDNHRKRANAKVFNCLLLQAAPDPVPQRK